MKKAIERMNNLLRYTSLPVIGGSIAGAILMYQAESLEKVKSYSIIMIGLYLGWFFFAFICALFDVYKKSED